MSTKVYLIGLLLFLVATPVQAEEPDAPVVDRIILKRKKKPEPVVDRIILRRKKKPQPEAPAPFPDGGFEFAEEPPLDLDLGSDASRSGAILNMAYSSGPLDRVKIGFGYWGSNKTGIVVQSGFSSSRDEKSIITEGGPRPVETLTWFASPEVSLMYATGVHKDLRFFVELGGGLHFSKAERQSVKSGYHAHLGPALQWILLPQYSLQLGERLNYVTFGSSKKYDIGLSTQLTASYWFE